ncbi:MAG: hypothetical protein HYV63_30560 [Candidatus Schekmanbacteria bacterium]|nr:hypothetical protein [Candidatus Schekmanbacteria bacterium]
MKIWWLPAVLAIGGIAAIAKVDRSAAGTLYGVESAGLYGGRPLSVAVDRSGGVYHGRMYVAVEGPFAVWRADPPAAEEPVTWAQSHAIATENRGYVVVDQTNGAVHELTEMDGAVRLFGSTDGGGTWQQDTLPEPGASFLAIDRTGRLLLGAPSALWRRGSDGVWTKSCVLADFSIVSASVFQDIKAYDGGRVVYAVVHVPATGAHLLFRGVAAVGTGPLVWEHLTGAPAAAFASAASPTVGTTSANTGAHTIYLDSLHTSTDGGQTFAEITSFSGYRGRVFADSQGHVFLGDRYSTDGGATWLVYPVSSETPKPTTFLGVDELGATTFQHLSSTVRGIALRAAADDANPWIAADQGLEAQTVFAIRSAGCAGRTYVGGHGGVYRTDNSGDTWTTTAFATGLPMVHALGLDPENADDLYAASDAIAHTADGGTSLDYLSPLHLGGSNSRFWTLAAFGDAPLFLGVTGEITEPLGVWRSDSPPATWALDSDTAGWPVNALAAGPSPVNPVAGLLLAGLGSTATSWQEQQYLGIRRLDPAAADPVWEEAQGAVASWVITAIERSTAEPTFVFAAGGRRQEGSVLSAFFRSTDAGNTWVRVPAELPEAYCLAMSLDETTREVYLGCDESVYGVGFEATELTGPPSYAGPAGMVIQALSNQPQASCTWGEGQRPIAIYIWLATNAGLYVSGKGSEVPVDTSLIFASLALLGTSLRLRTERRRRER